MDNKEIKFYDVTTNKNHNPNGIFNTATGAVYYKYPTIADMLNKVENENASLRARLENAGTLPLLFSFENGDCEIAYMGAHDNNFITIIHFRGENAKSNAEARLTELKKEKVT